MTLLKVNWLCLLMLICLISNGQSNNNEKQFGFEIGSIVPINYFGAGPLNLKDDHSTIILSSKIGYHFGMVMKTNYGEKFSFERGINFLRRNFKLVGSSNFNGIPMDFLEFQRNAWNSGGAPRAALAASTEPAAV